MRMTGRCLGKQVCTVDEHCAPCRDALSSMRPSAIGSPAIPVRRFGTLPPVEDDLAYEVMRDEVSARTIAEHGAAAVWMAALSAACLAGVLLYAV
jgi:hypothetical protein